MGLSWQHIGAVPIPRKSLGWLYSDRCLSIKRAQDLAVIEVAFLNGNIAPTIEQATADFNVLGIQMRGFHDFGVKKQDARGAIKMMGR